MSSITIYVLDSKGYLSSVRTGTPDAVMMAVDIEGLRYTLTPPPDDLNEWYWQDTKWQKTPQIADNVI